MPLSEIKAFCEMFGVDDPDDRWDLAEVVGQLDEEFSAFQKTKRGDE